MAEQAVATVVAPGTVIRGELRCAGDLVVHGRVEGAVSCGGALLLEAGGTIEAEVRARSAVLAGRVRGDVSVVEAAEIAPSCRLMGDLRAARVAIAPGAAIRGRVELGDVGTDDEAVWGAEEAGGGELPRSEAAIAGDAGSTGVAAATPPQAIAGAEEHPEAGESVAAATPPQAIAIFATAGAAAQPHVGSTSGDAPQAAPNGQAGASGEAAATPQLDAANTFASPPRPRAAPPPPPPSALALGVRSNIVLKR